MPTQIREKVMGFHSLTITLAVAFLALSITAITISSSLYIYSNAQTQERIIVDQQNFIAREAANTVKDFIEDKFVIMETTASFGGMAISNQEQQKLVMEKLLGRERSFRQIALLNTQGQEMIKVSRLPNSEPLKFAEQVKSDMLSLTSHGKMYISSVRIDETTSEPIVIMTVPVRDVFGDLRGVLAAEVNLKFIWDLVGGIKVGNSGVAYVIDKQGNLIAFGDISRVLKGENLIQLKRVSDFVNNPTLPSEGGAEVSKGIQGSDVISNFVSLGMPEWAVVVELPVAEAYEPVKQGLIISSLIMLLGVVLSVLISIYLSKRITQPIINLRNAADDIGEGNLDVKIDINSKDEIGQLAASFSKMTANLKKSNKSIEEYSKTLEKQIVERTRELEAKIKELTDTKTAVLNIMEDTDETNKNLSITQSELKINIEKLREIDKKKDEFISVAAHELKTPLTSIRGFSQLLLDESVIKDEEKRRKYIKIIEKETIRLAKLVTDILDLSRIDLGTFKLNEEETDINVLLDDVIKEISIQITEKGLKFGQNIEEKLPRTITDTGRLMEVLLNLLNNALKYTESGSITLKVFEEKGFIHFAVKDTGIGIAKKDQKRLFERFYQVDSSFTRKAGGTGLGLSISREYVKAMGGDIDFSSEPGKGSEFIFSIPIKTGAMK
jgi:signal transduction histidine kinase